MTPSFRRRQRKFLVLKSTALLCTWALAKKSDVSLMWHEPMSKVLRTEKVLSRSNVMSVRQQWSSEPSRNCRMLRGLSPFRVSMKFLSFHSSSLTLVTTITSSIFYLLFISLFQCSNDLRIASLRRFLEITLITVI